MTMLKLVSLDGESFMVDSKVAMKSVLVKNLLGDLGDDNVQEIPLPMVRSNILKKVLEWCEHHKDDVVSNEDESESSSVADQKKKNTRIDEWDQKFLQVDQEMLFEIILAANYMDISLLLEVGCKTVAGMIRGKSPEEIRKEFNIMNDFTPEEELQIRRENEWAEDR